MKFRDDMAQDHFRDMREQLQLQREQGLTDEQLQDAYRRALGNIQLHLQSCQSGLDQFPSLPQQYTVPADQLSSLESMEILERHAYPQDLQHTESVRLSALLNQDQRSAYDHIMHAVNGSRDNGNLFFVNGPGGTGKSLLFKSILAQVRSQDQIALPVASSGIAAILLPGGRTAHSRFKIPVSNEPTLSCRVSLGTPTAHLIKSAALILWDEAVMSSRFNFEAVDRLLKDIMGADDPALEHVLFGGKVVVFGGDFRQILPVVPKGTPSQIIADCIISSYIWQGVKVLTLVENMRVRGTNQEAVDFAKMLLAVGNGDPPYQEHVQIPRHWLLDSEDVSTLINKIYPSLSLASDPSFFATRAILTTKNQFVDRINNHATQAFPGAEMVYRSNDCVIDGDDPDADSMNYPVEFLNRCNPSGLPSHTLAIKVGMPLIILRNIDVENGLCNVKAYIGGNEFLIPRINFTSNEDELPFSLRPAFAMTIHKSQGQTLNHVGVYLNESAFTHGQLYVALSRATDPASLSIAVPLSNSSPTSSSTSPTAKNVVYRSVLK
ncbi:hypothetical protein [Absidia glauca]|uniref:ATP-dependent DNA helicase n=1 Tax=Absidia glauca TaxID=4829 RepID=A0A168L341_ABSGL|nr:hypothetical protein [Absidia glauca]